MSNEAQVLIPAGSIDLDREVAVVEMKIGDFFNLNSALKPLGPTYSIKGFNRSQIEVQDLLFDTPVSITLPYDPDLISPLSPSDLKVVLSNNESVADAELMVIDDFSIDEENQLITFETDRDGFYALAAPADLIPETPTFSDLFGNRIYFPYMGQ